MTLVRPTLPNKSYMVTRNCAQRAYLLRPDRDVNALLEYCLAYAALQHPVLLHAYCFLSSHFHLMLSDPAGHLPKFMHRLDMLIARKLNRHYQRSENLWKPGSYDRRETPTAEDILLEATYVVVNPVAAGAVKRVEDYPGVVSGTGEPRRKVVERPRRFFSPQSELPRTVVLELEAPPLAFDDDSTRGFWERLAERVEVRQAEHRERFFREGRSFEGAARVLAQPITKRASRARKREPEEKSRESREVTCIDPGLRREVEESYREFRREYSEARLEFAAGERDVLFPAGTYWLRIYCGVYCRPPPPP